MPAEKLHEIKKNIANRYGEAFVSKASEALLKTLALPQLIPMAAGTEAFADRPPADIVIEFEEQPVQHAAAPSRNEEVSKRIAEVVKSIGPDVANVDFDLKQMVQRAYLKSFRDSVMRSMQTAGSYLESQIEKTFARSKASLEDQRYITQVCWLNQCMRAKTAPQSLAEMAADPAVKKLDTPNKLQAELDITSTTIQAGNYRANTNLSGKGVIVAVIDSEVHLEHPALQNRVIHMRNYTKEAWGSPDGHGTGVAGVIASSGPNYIGIAPEALIYNYKVLATNRILNSDDFEGALAIQRALEDGAHIANCSWQSGELPNGRGRAARACNAAWQLGMAIVKSAGNNGAAGAGTITSPGDADGVLVVGATDRRGATVEEYSSRGPLMTGAQRPHLVAPGGSPLDGVWSCLPTGAFGDIRHGTSFAAPHVSGILALLIEQDPHVTPDELRNRILELCRPFPGIDLNIQGSGMVIL